jgi:histone acetyltransferase MYST1
MSSPSFQRDDIVTCFCPFLNSEEKAQIFDFRPPDLAYVHFLRADKRLDDWVPLSWLNPTNEGAEEIIECPLTRARRRALGIELSEPSDDPDESIYKSPRMEEAHRRLTRMRNIESITLGDNRLRTWYFSPFPSPFHTFRHLYVCEYCWRYFGDESAYEFHRIHSRERCPCGRQIYRADGVAVFELRGTVHKVRCQNLCLLGTLFLEHKTLYYDIEAFVFYVLCVCDNAGAHFAGYFSREIDAPGGNVLACIVVLPQYQKRGFGRLMVAMSYEIARRKGRPGCPEGPFSDIGRLMFYSYWREMVIRTLMDCVGEVASAKDIAQSTGIGERDVIEVLRDLKLIRLKRGTWRLELEDVDLMPLFQQLTPQDERPGRFFPSMFTWLPTDDDRD